MSMLFELHLNTMEIDIDGIPASFPSSFHMAPQAEDELNRILEPYDMDTDSFFGYYGWVMRVEGFKPWAFIFFRTEYCLAGHMEHIRDVCHGVSAGSYSAFFVDEQPESMPVEISFLMLRDKAALQRAAALSDLFKPAWNLLKNREDHRHWVCLSRPPDNEWLFDNIMRDRDLLLNTREKRIRERCTDSPADWLFLARKVMDGFDNTEPERVTAYISQGEASAQNAQQLAFAAELWLDTNLPDARGTALKCMEKAELVAREQEWLTIAQTWDLFGPDQAHRVLNAMKHAETHASESTDFLQCAETWIKTTCDRPVKNAYLAVLNAEDNAKESWDWISCAETWRSMFGTGVRDWCNRCLRRGEALAKSVDDFIWCAEAWHHVAGPEGAPEYRRCMNAAEAISESAEDWTKCAEAHLYIFGNEERASARSCMIRAETSANKAEDWCMCAASWSRVFDHEFSADEEKCLRRACASASSVNEHLDCAELCSALDIHSDINIPRFLMRAEELASDPDEWVLCAEAWQKLWSGNHGSEAVDNARRCTERARQLARSEKPATSPLREKA